MCDSQRAKHMCSHGAKHVRLIMGQTCVNHQEPSICVSPGAKLVRLTKSQTCVAPKGLTSMTPHGSGMYDSINTTPSYTAQTDRRGAHCRENQKDRKSVV